MTTALPDHVTTVEALQLLGLPDDPSAPSPDALTLRRAYVRAIKRYSPEANPQEFQRVRSAYEFLEQRRQWASYVARPTPDEAGPEPAESPSSEGLDGSDAPEVDDDRTPVPAWMATLDELTSLLAWADVIEPRHRPATHLSHAQRSRLLELTWYGWPPLLDAPIMRLVARFFELDLQLEAHVLADRFVYYLQHVAPERAPDANVKIACLQRVIREARRGLGPEGFARIYRVLDDRAEEPRPATNAGSTEARILWRMFATLVIALIIIAFSVLTLRAAGHGSDGASAPPGVDREWVRTACHHEPRDAMLCETAVSLQASLEAGDCGLVAQLLRTYDSQLASDAYERDRLHLTLIARDAAHDRCPDHVASPTQLAPSELFSGRDLLGPIHSVMHR